MDLEAIRAAIRDRGRPRPITSMLTLENSHALSMGQPLLARPTSRPWLM